MSDEIRDVVWEDYLYIYELLGSTDNYTVGGTTLTPALAGDIITNTIAEDEAYSIRQMKISDTFSHDRETRFKVNISWTSGVETGSVQEQVTYITTIDDATAIIGLDGDKVSAVGFKAVNDKLYGLTMAGGSESLIELKDIVYDTYYVCELRYYPDRRVDYYIDGILLGSLSTTLPVSSDNGLNIFNAHIKTTDSAQKYLSVEYFEFMQQRKK
jgi:hypothetical protein